jgi:hypothetical protein
VEVVCIEDMFGRKGCRFRVWSLGGWSAFGCMC